MAKYGNTDVQFLNHKHAKEMEMLRNWNLSSGERTLSSIEGAIRVLLEVPIICVLARILNRRKNSSFLVIKVP